MNFGLCSISFRQLSPEEVIRRVTAAGLDCIEWGSDVHAPCDHTDCLRKIALLQKQAGLFCSSYGTYFHAGQDAPEGFRAYCEAAKILGTETLRIWCGTKRTDLNSAEEKSALFSDCRAIVKIAEEYGMTVCPECHGNTFTETLDGALELMQNVRSESFRMYWQPNQYRSVEENLHYARAIAPYTVNLHVFQWKDEAKFSLADGTAEWRDYLSCFDGVKTLLLEFMPDDSPDSLPAEAAALRELV